MAEDNAPKLTGRREPPPIGKAPFYGMMASPPAFGSPPDEPVEIVGEVPWELSETD